MKKIVIAGFGGQGVLSMGLMLAQSAMYMDYNTSWLPSYGPEMRGGTANVAVTYSRGEIACPLISHPDFLVAFNAPSLDKFVSSLETGGTLLVNSSAVTKKPSRTDIKTVYVPVADLAAPINPRGGNLIMLGVILPLLKTIDRSAAEKAVRYVFEKKPNLIDSNLRCLDRGMEYAEKEILR